MRSSKRKCGGQALLESALVTLVFLTVLIGVLDVGQFLFIHQTLEERARNAVRYGIARNFDAQAIRNMVLFNQPAAGIGSGVFGLTTAMVNVTRQDAGQPEDRIVVTISNYPIRFFTPFVARVTTGRPIVTSLPYEGG